MAGHGEARDGPFTVTTLLQFQNELLAGHLPPRWVASGYAGLGSPIFIFYPPGAYFAASLVGLALPALSTATIIGLAQLLFRATALLTCFVWMRRRIGRDAALIGSALYAVMPWISVVNPQVRLAFAECAATAVVPLVFLAVDVSLGVDAGRRNVLKAIALVAVIMCLLTFVHLPTTVVAGGLVVVYAAMSVRGWRERIRATAVTAVGVMLGLGLAACYLLPAIELLPAISSAALWNSSNRPEAFFILAPATFHSMRGVLLDASLLVPAFLALTFCRSAIFCRRDTWTLIGTLAVAVFLTLPISAPVWATLTPLRMIQFPSRFLVPVSLLAAALTATALSTFHPGLRQAALAAGFGLGAAGIGFVLWFGDGMTDGAARTRQALAHAIPIAPEYVPVGGGWLAAAGGGRTVEDVQARTAELKSACAQRRSQSASVADAEMTFDVSGCSGTAVLPHFYFPGWIAQAGAQNLVVKPDVASGFVSVVVPPGTESVTLRRTRLSVELLGLLVSGISLFLWSAIAVAAAWSRQRLARSVAT